MGKITQKSLNSNPKTLNRISGFIKQIPPVIIVLLLLFLVRGIIFISIMPPWQAPDEPLHYDYLHYLATAKRWPVLKADVGSPGVTLCSKVQKSLGGYHFSSLTKGKTPYISSEEVTAPDDYRGSVVHDKKGYPNQIIQHPPLYYLGGAFIYLLGLRFFSLTVQIWVLRLFSVILGLLTVYLGYLSAKELFENKPYLQYGLVAFLALTPMFGYILSVINNDALTIFLFSLLFYLMAVSIKREINRRRLYALAVIFALGMLTKVSFAVALPAILFVIAVSKKKDIDWKSYLVAFGIVFVLAGWWYIRLFLVYGTLLPRVSFYPPNPANRWAGISLPGFLYYTPFKNKLFKTFWGSFGWLKVHYPYRIYFILKYMTYLIMVGLGLDVVIKLFRKIKWDKDMQLLVLSIGLVAILLISIMLPAWSGLKKTGFMEGVQGRYLFPLMIPLAFLLMLSVYRLIPSTKGFWVFTAVSLAVLVLDSMALFLYVLPYFYG